jgi:hypothetical protein
MLATGAITLTRARPAPRRESDVGALGQRVELVEQLGVHAIRSASASGSPPAVGSGTTIASPPASTFDFGYSRCSRTRSESDAGAGTTRRFGPIATTSLLRLRGAAAQPRDLEQPSTSAGAAP